MEMMQEDLYASDQNLKKGEATDGALYALPIPETDNHDFCLEP